MEEKKVDKLADQLLEARKEGIDRFKEGMLRPHGKLFGMNVFSWMNPNLEAIQTTIKTLPFPVFLIANLDLINALKQDVELMSCMDSIVCFDHANFFLEINELLLIRNAAGTGSVKDALCFVSAFKDKDCVFLFSSNSVEFEHHKLEFESFLKLHQLRQ